ncbi:MAG: hypothetical protein RLY21_1966 [Planctomycetota bacterium]|jgi:formyltetrahydrofolate-dependent phosphoribosylglycinamide formyltransferase
MNEPARIAVLISGGGRTAANIHEACLDGRVRARVALVVAHREEISGVARCRALGLRVAVVPAGDSLADRIDSCLAAAEIDLVCLAGYLRRFRVGTRWSGRTLNIHPALLPRFGGKGMYGMRVHEAVLAAGVTESGCTVHEVDEEYDHGATVLERRCAVLADDTTESLADRVYREELAAYPQAIAMTLERLAQTPLVSGSVR